MIVSLTQLLEHLGLPTAPDADRDALCTRLLTQCEQAFLTQCGRAERPFASASTSALVETLDGTGTGTCFATRPIKSVTSLVVGDPAAPRATYLPADLVFTVGSTMLRAKTPGVVFGTVDEPGALQLTYRSAADLPEDVQIAITRAAAALYLQRGAEDVSVESEGGVRSELAAAFADPAWQSAVAAHHEPALG